MGGDYLGRVQGFQHLENSLLGWNVEIVQWLIQQDYSRIVDEGQAMASFCMFPRESFPTLARSYSRRLNSSKNLSVASRTFPTPRRSTMYSKIYLLDRGRYGVAFSGRYPRIDVASELNGT